MRPLRCRMGLAMDTRLFLPRLLTGNCITHEPNLYEEQLFIDNYSTIICACLDSRHIRKARRGLFGGTYVLIVHVPGIPTTPKQNRWC